MPCDRRPDGKLLGRPLAGRIAIATCQLRILEHVERPPRKLALRIGRHDPARHAVYDQLSRRIARHCDDGHPTGHGIEDRPTVGHVARLPDELARLDEIGKHVAEGHHPQPFGELLHARPPLHPRRKGPLPHEHVLDTTVHDLQLIDRPHEPLEPSLAHERGDAQRPLRVGAEPEPGSQIVPRQPGRLRRLDPRRENIDPARSHADRLAAARDAGRNGDHTVEPRERPAKPARPWPRGQVCDGCDTSGERSNRSGGQCRRSTPRVDDRGLPASAQRGKPRRCGHVESRPRADAMHRIAPGGEPRRHRPTRRAHCHRHVPAGGPKCVRRKLDLPTGAYRVEPARDHEHRPRPLPDHPPAPAAADA